MSLTLQPVALWVNDPDVFAAPVSPVTSSSSSSSFGIPTVFLATNFVAVDRAHRQPDFIEGGNAASRGSRNGS